MGCVTSKPCEVEVTAVIFDGPSPWTHVVFSGGGANGIMYAGAYRAAWDAGVIASIEGAAGTSIGSLFATLAVMRVDPRDIRDEILELDTDYLMDNSWSLIDDAIKFVNNLGFYRGKYLEKWCERVIARSMKRSNCTFAEMYRITGRRLRILVCNETRGRAEYWDHESQPSMPVSYAIRTSASIPFMYDPVRYLNDLYIDGGVCNIYPLDAFDNLTTLGFLLLRDSEQKAASLVRQQHVTNLLTHVVAVYECMAATQFALQHPGTEWSTRTVALQGPDKAQWDMQFTRDEKLRWINVSYKTTVAELIQFRSNKTLEV